MRCFGGGVHFCFISSIGTAQSALQRFKIRNNVRCLAGVEPKLRHVHVSRANAFKERFLQVFDRIP
jgi:hypothetical protein